MKRITLSIITGVCLMIAGQASAHSGHHSPVSYTHLTLPTNREV